MTHFISAQAAIRVATNAHSIVLVIKFTAASEAKAPVETVLASEILLFLVCPNSFWRSGNAFSDKPAEKGIRIDTLTPLVVSQVGEAQTFAYIAVESFLRLFMMTLVDIWQLSSSNGKSKMPETLNFELSH